MGRAPSLPGGEGGIFQQICKGARPIWGAPLPSPGAEGGHFNNACVYHVLTIGARSCISPGTRTQRRKRRGTQGRYAALERGGAKKERPLSPWFWSEVLEPPYRTKIEECRGPGLDPAPWQHALW